MASRSGGVAASVRARAAATSESENDLEAGGGSKGGQGPAGTFKSPTLRVEIDDSSTEGEDNRGTGSFLELGGPMVAAASAPAAAPARKGGKHGSSTSQASAPVGAPPTRRSWANDPGATPSRGSVQMKKLLPKASRFVLKTKESMANLTIDTILNPDAFNNADHVVSGQGHSPSITPMQRHRETLPVRELYAALHSMQASNNLYDLALYLCFISLYIYIVLATVPVTRLYDQISLIEDIFLDEEFVTKIDTTGATFYDFDGPVFKKNYYDIFSYDEYWQWVEGPLLNGIFANTNYNGGGITDPRDMFVLQSGFSGNKVIGAVQFRTAKVKQGVHCKNLEPAAPDSSWGEPRCYPRFQKSYVNCSEWAPFGECSYGMSDIRGLPGYGPALPLFSLGGYGESGYTYNIPILNATDQTPTTLQQARDQVRFLKDNFWTNEATRVLSVDFNIAGLDMANLVAVRFVVQVMQGGGFKPYWRAYPIMTQAGPNGIEKDKCEILFILMVLYYIAKMGLTLRNQPRKTAFLLRNFWACVDIVNLCIFCVVFALLFYAQFNKYSNDFVRSVTSKQSEYVEIFDDARFTIYISILMCVNLMIGMMKAFKFLRLMPYMTIMWETLTKCFNELFSLMAAAFIVYSAFSFLGHIMFGLWVEDYHSFTAAFSIIARSSLGEANYEPLRDSEPNFAPFYYVLMTFFVTFMLFNMFIAIIVEYYSIAKERKTVKMAFFRSVGTTMVISRSAMLRARMKHWLFEVYVAKGKIQETTVKDLFNVAKHLKAAGHAAAGLKGKSSKRKRRKEPKSTLKPFFISCPSNWTYDSPTLIKHERERWIAAALERNEREAAALKQENGASKPADDSTKRPSMKAVARTSIIANQLKASENISGSDKKLIKAQGKKVSKMLGVKMSAEEPTDNGAGVGIDSRDGSPVDQDSRRAGSSTSSSLFSTGFLSSVIGRTVSRGPSSGDNTAAAADENASSARNAKPKRSASISGGKNILSSFVPIIGGGTPQISERSEADSSSTLEREGATTPLNETETAGAYMWRWVVQTLARKRQEKLVEMRTYFGEPFPAQVERTRQLLEKRYGPDTCFKNNWNAVVSENDLKSKMRSMNAKAGTIEARFKINRILWRAVERNSRKHKRDMFSVFGRTWKRMTTRGHYGELTREDLLLLFGYEEGDDDCLNDVEELILLHVYNTKLRQDSSDAAQQEDFRPKTTLETVERKIAMLADQVVHVENVLSEIVKKPMATQETQDYANPSPGSIYKRHTPLRKKASHAFFGRNARRSRLSSTGTEESSGKGFTRPSRMMRERTLTSDGMEEEMAAVVEEVSDEILQTKSP